MNPLCLFAVFTMGVMGGSPAGAAMNRIIGLGHAINDPDVQWLMKQTDLLLIIVSSPHWQATMEERRNFINVIERFVSDTISGPLGVDIREAAAIFERWNSVYKDGYSDDCGNNLSVFALSLAHDLETNAPSLPTLLSDPDFPMDTDRRILLASIASIERRLNGSPISYIRRMYKTRCVWSFAEAGYLEMLLDVYTKVEDRYTRLCQQTGVDVQHTYRPRMYLNRYWGDDIQEDTDLVHSIILPLIDDPQEIEFAKKVGLCLDFARRHHPYDSIRTSPVVLSNDPAQSSGIDPDVICRQLITRGVNWSDYHPSRTVPTPLPDANPPMAMESADARTIRVTRLVEVVALGVPEIRDIFPLIHGPASMFKFERILWEHLDHPKRYPNEGVGMDRLAYNLVRLLGIRILHLPMMRERYFNSLSLKQFEGFRRIISCMARLEPRVDISTPPQHYVRYALSHPDEIEFISRGLEALTRLYKKFQQDPIWSGEYHSVARHRTVVGFLPAYLVFGRFGFNADQFRQRLEWVIAHECAFLSQASLSRLVAGDLFCLDDPMDTVLKFLGGNSFDKLVFALDGFFREPVARFGSSSNRIQQLGFEFPKRIFVAVTSLGGMEAIEAPLRAQLLRIVPVLIKLMRAVSNGQLHLSPSMPEPNAQTARSITMRLYNIIANLKPNDEAEIKAALDVLEELITPPQTNSIM